jgi:hypothetical protein
MLVDMNLLRASHGGRVKEDVRVRTAIAVFAAFLVPTAASFAATLESPPTPAPLSMISEMPGGPGLDAQRLQAVLERYPEIATGPERDGVYVVAAAFKRDGSIHESHMRYATKAEQLDVREELAALLPRDGRNSTGAMARKGPWINGGNLGADILVELTVLPPDFDEATSARRVQDAVRPMHSDLMLSRLIGKFNLLTVFMTTDGRIDREHVQSTTIHELRNVIPEYASAEDFKVLGLKPEELGRMDMTTISRPMPGSEVRTTTLPDGRIFTQRPEQEVLTILYAWPRGMGQQHTDASPARPSPAGALIPIARAAASRTMSDPSRLQQGQQREAHVIAELVKRYPEIVDGPERDGHFTFVIVFQPDGTVFREGMRYADNQPQTNVDRQELSDSMRERTTGMTTMDMRRKGDVLPDGRVVKSDFNYTYSVLRGDFDSLRLPGGPEDHRNALRRLALRLFPDVETQPSGLFNLRPWVLLSHAGEVLLTGRAVLEADEIFLAGTHLRPLMPGVRFAEVESEQFGRRQDPKVHVMFVWLAADSPLPPAIP